LTKITTAIYNKKIMIGTSTAASIVERADMLMYQSKRAGKDQVSFE